MEFATRCVCEGCGKNIGRDRMHALEAKMSPNGGDDFHTHEAFEEYGEIFTGLSQEDIERKQRAAASRAKKRSSFLHDIKVSNGEKEYARQLQEKKYREFAKNQGKPKPGSSFLAGLGMARKWY